MQSIDKKAWIRYAKEKRINRRISILCKYMPENLRIRKKDSAGQNYVYKDELDINEFNYFVINAIKNQTPCFVGRFGETEMNVIVSYLNYEFGFGRDERMASLQQLYTNAGFFPKEVEYGKKFVDIMFESIKNIDVQATWNLNMEDILLENLVPKVKTTKLMNVSPWVKYRYGSLESKPWTSALANKKVLVIHPFAETIFKQYTQKREQIFSKLYDAEYILPEFDLYTLKAVQTIAGNKDERFATWFDALDWMKKECEKIDFDVAIIGCGAYGYPLASEIKKMGKVAIHLGGATQILFGILGGI